MPSASATPAASAAAARRNNNQFVTRLIAARGVCRIASQRSAKTAIVVGRALARQKEASLEPRGNLLALLRVKKKAETPSSGARTQDGANEICPLKARSGLSCVRSGRGIVISS